MGITIDQQFLKKEVEPIPNNGAHILTECSYIECDNGLYNDEFHTFILTKHFNQKKNKILVMHIDKMQPYLRVCKSDLKSVNHLFFKFSYAHQTWHHFISIFARRSSPSTSTDLWSI